MSLNNENKTERKENKREKHNPRASEKQIKTLEAMLEKANEETQKLEDEKVKLQGLLQRKTADFDNFRKRTIKEKTDFMVRANQDLILEILPMLDNFERGLNAAEESKNFDALVEGIKMVHSSIHTLFEDYKITPIDAVGQEFDHNLHQAMNFMGTEDESLHNTVAEEFEKGYYMDDKVIRTSKVIVWKKKEA